MYKPYYNEGNSFLFVNATTRCQFKAKDSEIKNYPLCLGNISVNIMKKTGLNECAYIFSVDYRALDTSNIIDIYKYFMKKHKIK